MVFIECEAPQGQEQSDEHLCLLAQEGDRDAEERLIERYHRTVRAITRPYFLIGGDSDDLLQEGMMGLVKAVREFKLSRDVTFRTFAEVCIRNRMFSALRAAAREKHSPLNQSISIEAPFFDSSSYATVTGHAPDPEELMIHQENRQRELNEILTILSPLERKVLRLFLDGFTYREIADALGKPLKSVENAVHRIRQKAAR